MFATASTVFEFFVPLSYFFGVVGVIGVVFAFVRYDNYKTTVQLQNDNIKALEDQANIHETNANTNKEHIKLLEARINVIETLPLQTILEELKNIGIVQNKILQHMVDK